jgi:hypothetical protein
LKCATGTFSNSAGRHPSHGSKGASFPRTRSPETPPAGRAEGGRVALPTEKRETDCKLCSSSRPGSRTWRGGTDRRFRKTHTRELGVTARRRRKPSASRSSAETSGGKVKRRWSTQASSQPWASWPRGCPRNQQPWPRSSGTQENARSGKKGGLKTGISRIPGGPHHIWISQRCKVIIQSLLNFARQEFR